VRKSLIDFQFSDDLYLMMPVRSLFSLERPLATEESLY
jgi:hypothetical protein